MQRRNFLQLMAAATAVGASLPGLSFAEQSDPLKACAQRFAKARQQHAVLAGWQSAPLTGAKEVKAQLKGKWPNALQGTLYRNGPGNFERGEQRYLHWFDGDGLLQAWRINAAGVSHRAQFVQTPKFVREQKSNRFEVMAAGTTIKDARPVSGPDDVNTANISVLHLHGKSYALWEAGSAFEFDRETLQTKSIKTWRDDLEGVAFSAHPVYEPDGSIWNVGMLGTNMVIYHVSAEGELLRAQLLELPRGGYMHSFTASASRLVFVLAPLVHSKNAGSYFESLEWQPKLGSLLIIVDKNKLDHPRFVDFEAGASYHYADAWDEADGSLSLRTCWSDYETNNMTFISPMQHMMQGRPMADVQALSPTLCTLRVPVAGARASMVQRAQAHIEFPMQTRLMRNSPLLLLQASNKPGYNGALSALLLVDGQSKTQARFDLGGRYLLEEHLPVRAGGKTYALGTVLDGDRARTGLLLFDLAAINAGPVAEAWLEQAFPLGFHGSFLAS